MNWHQRYVQQARWTHEVRHFLLNKIGIGQNDPVMEVGCGTGAVLSDLPEPVEAPTNLAAQTQIVRFGLDIDFQSLVEARRNTHHTAMIHGDALELPFASSAFRLVYCHYLLLWLDSPLHALLEMKRVAQPAGWIAAFAETDYGARIDYPDSLSSLGQGQVMSLKQQGADPLLGRKLRMLFSQAGLSNIESGILGARWSAESNLEAQDLEWDVTQQDLMQVMTKKELSSLKEIDRKARLVGERVLFVPTFYAVGQVPDSPIS